MNEMDSVGVGIVEMCITGCLMELWATLFAGCGKAALAFPYAVNGVVHSGIASYAHFHDAFLDTCHCLDSAYNCSLNCEFNICN